MTQSFQTVYGGVAAIVPANSDLDSVEGRRRRRRSRRTRSSSRYRRHAEFIGATTVWPSLGGPDNAGEDVDRRRPRHRHLARASVVRRPRPPAPPARPRTPASSATARDAAHLGAAFTCNHKLIGAYAFTETYMAVVGAGAGRVLQQHDAHLLGRATPRATARTPSSTAAGDRVDSAPLFGVERGPISGIAPGARVIMYRVCARTGLLQLRLGGRGPAGDPRRRRRDQLLDLRRGEPVHRRGRARVPRRVQRGHLRQRLGRQLRPGRGDGRPRRPVGDDGRRVDVGPRSSPRRCT